MQNFTRILMKVLIPDSRILEAIDVIRNRVGPPGTSLYIDTT